MILADLLADLRQSRLYDTVAPFLWSDAELVRHLNDAVRQVCLRQRCLLETEDTDICQIPVSAGQRLVDLHPSVLAVRFAYPVPAAGGSPMHRPTGITTKRLLRDHPHWDTDPTDTGELRHWIPDYQTGKLALYPVSPVDYTLQLGVWRMPLPSETLVASEPMTAAQLAVSPIIAEHWHADLLDWVEYRCLNKPDVDAESAARAQAAAQTFAAKIGRLPSATEIRLWGVSPTLGIQPEFL